MMAKIYLSKTNLLALLSKLDRKAAGDSTACSIVKYRQPSNEYKQTMGSITVVAVDDESYYNGIGRSRGIMHPADEANLK